MGNRGDSYDDALAEMINELYSAELIHRRAPWKTRGSLSLILCARHTMTHRSMYAKQEEAAGRVAGHPH